VIYVHVVKRLGEFELDARFEASRGVTALFGPSGSGKSSIINMIAGIMQPDRGRILVDGKLLFDAGTGYNPPLHRRRIGYVFQDGRLFPHLSVRRNLEYGRRRHGLKPDPDLFGRVTEMLDLRHMLNRWPGTLSGGERQRVAIGRALLMRPWFLLLDEPLASLDARRKAEIMPYLVRLRDETGTAMIYVSHHAAEIRQIATDVVRIENGRVVATGGVDLIEQETAPLAQ
jgi:molybdate transport system ATP-binding protein